MRKVIPFALLLLCVNARGQFAAQYNFQDFTQNSQPVKAVYLTPLWNVTVFNTTNIIASQRQSKQTDSQGSLIVSNMVYGAYRVEFIGVNRTNIFTNCFDSSISAGTLVNAADYICVGTNATSSSDYAYTRGQSNGRFMTNPPVSASAGYVLTATDTSGHYDWEQGGGSGGGITAATGTNIVNGSTGVIQTNGAARGTTFIFSPTGTNAIAGMALIAPWANWSTNVFGSAAFQPSTAFISPAQLAILSNNVNGANIFGQVPAASLGTGSSISAKFLRGDLTWQTITGGGDVLAANNLSDLANKATALSNLGGASTNAAVLTNDTRNVTFGGTHTNVNGIVIPGGNSLTDTNAVESRANVVQDIRANTVDLGPLAPLSGIYLLGLGPTTNTTPVHLGTGLAYDSATSNLNVTVSGGSSVFSVTNVIASTTNELLLDLANYNVFKIWCLTNTQWKLTNASSLTQKAYIYYQQDTNGGRILNGYVNAGGLVQTNANMQPTTNGNAVDVLELIPGFFPTNIFAYWPQNFQPRAGFTNSLSTGGGGGGGAAWTLIDHKSIAASGNVSTLTVSGLNTVGANLVVFIGVHTGGGIGTGSTSPSDTVGASSTYVAANPKVQFFYVISPQSSASYSVTVAVGGNSIDSIQAFSFNKSGGTPAFDAEAAGSRSGNWQNTTVAGGSVTPATSADLIFTTVAWDVLTVTSASVDSGFTTSPDGILTHTYSALTAYKNKSDGTAENPGWLATPNNSNSDADTSTWFMK